MDAQEFDRMLKEETEIAEQVLQKYLPKEEGWQKEIVEAMNYSLLAGGKRLRPVLMRQTFLMCGGKEDAVIEAFMAAIEMIHTYSLVHDDLPAMDNDLYRRGKKTTWHVYGDAMGILAGDGLLNYAFETAIGAVELCYEDGEAHPDWEDIGRIRHIWTALSVLAGKAGIRGMIGGQAVDVMSEKKPDDSGEMTEDKLMFIHGHKTAALIQASMMIGAILAGASGKQVADIEKCAYNIGMAFQIQDDILDVVGDSRELGKSIGSDAQNHKLTYVTMKGLEQARKDVEVLSLEAAAILEGFAGEHEFLKKLILTLIYRRK